MNHGTKYLSKRSFRLKIITQTHRHAHTADLLHYTWPINWYKEEDSLLSAARCRVRCGIDEQLSPAPFCLRPDVKFARSSRFPAPSRPLRWFLDPATARRKTTVVNRGGARPAPALCPSVGPSPYRRPICETRMPNPITETQTSAIHMCAANERQTRHRRRAPSTQNSSMKRRTDDKRPVIIPCRRPSDLSVLVRRSARVDY